MAKLILARHGQSIWNQLNLFTGWVDIALSQQGIEESFHIGQVISSLDIDVVYTSALVRAQMTALIAMTVHSSKKIPYLEPKANDPMQQWYQKGSNSQGLIPAYTAWELNERMYGDLQGKNKEEMMAEYGAEQVHQWRRSFLQAPPGGESLYDTASRAIPFFKRHILPKVLSGENVFVCAHGNSLRAIVMDIEQMSEQEVLKLEIATGEVLLYECTEGSLLRL